MGVDALTWVQVSEDRLANFCFHCGCVGHNRKTCLLTNHITIMGSDGVSVLVFGIWLRSDYGDGNCFTAH